MKIAMFIIAGLLLLLIVCGGYVFAFACVRRKEFPWLDSEALKGTDYEKFDQIIHNSHDWLVAQNAQDVFVTSKDGLKLHGLWVPAKDSKATVLLAHGYRSTMLIDFGKVLKLYHDMGVNLLLPEQRSHGKSQGKLITFGVKESLDMLCWLDYHNMELSDCQVILSGLSMGASTMMYLADRPLPENVKGFIVDCGFTSPAAIISKVYKSVTHMPAGPVLWIADLWARIVGRFSLYERDSRKTLAKCTLPIMMVHGKEDHFVPCYMTEQGFAACSSEKQVLLAEGAGHGTSFLYAQDAYVSMVEGFFKKNIEGF